MVAFTEELARATERTYESPDVVATRQAAFAALAPRRGEAAIDIGVGPGFLLKDLALAVGAGGRAVGVDLSAPMLALAAARCGDLAHVRLKSADAATLPVEDASMDMASEMQTYCYVADIDRALAEMARVLKPGGRAILLETDYDSLVWRSDDPARMARMVEAHRAHAAWTDLPRRLPELIARAGLRLRRCEAIPMLSVQSAQNTYVAGLLTFMSDFLSKQEGVAPEEVAAWAAEQRALDQDGRFFFSLNRYLFTIVKP